MVGQGERSERMKALEKVWGRGSGSKNGRS